MGARRTKRTPSRGTEFSKDLIRGLKNKFGVTTSTALAAKLGITDQSIQNWKKRDRFTARQVSELAYRAHMGGAQNLQASAIRPIVEFFPIEITASKQGRKVEIFGVKTASGKTHSYLDGLRSELRGEHGVYVFFDSRGRAIYAGKARRTKLWNEINGAFNRDRGRVQKIKRVKHPARNQPYKTSGEMARQIVERVVPLHDLASYFSAYRVTDSMINEVEAMLVRSFANDLLNKKMERFGQQRRKPGKKGKKRKARKR